MSALGDSCARGNDDQLCPGCAGSEYNRSRVLPDPRASMRQARTGATWSRSACDGGGARVVHLRSGASRQRAVRGRPIGRRSRCQYRGRSKYRQGRSSRDLFDHRVEFRRRVASGVSLFVGCFDNLQCGFVGPVPETLDAGASVTVTMSATANPCGLSITRDATVVAEVSSTGPEVNLSNNSDRVTIRLQRCHQR